MSGPIIFAGCSGCAGTAGAAGCPTHSSMIPDPATCAICGHYVANGVEVHEVCLPSPDPVAGLREALRAVLRDFDREPTEEYLDEAERIFRALASDKPGLDADGVALFVNGASTDMYHRMREGERRGWGESWKTDYPDERVTDRLGRAVEDLFHALRVYRDGAAGIDEVRKRAADVANQAFMLADAARIRERET